MAFSLKGRVWETTTSQGTGNLTVAGAVAGYRTWADAGYANGDTFFYAIKHRTTAEFEIGLGKYVSATPAIQRLEVLESSNANAAVDFTAGTKDIWVDFPGKMASSVREKLQADRTYYVRTDGSDSNDGKANTPGGAWLTVTHAYDVIRDTLDLNGYAVTIQVANATWTTQFLLVGRCTGQKKITDVKIQGNVGTPGNCIVSTTSAHAIEARAGARFGVTGFKLQTTTAGNCIATGVEGADGTEFNACEIDVGCGNASSIEFGATASGYAHVASRFGATVKLSANYTVSGGAGYHMLVFGWSHLIATGITVTLTGTPAFGNIFAYAEAGSTIHAPGNTYSGSATGTRYSAVGLSLIGTGGGGANYFPGNVAGSTGSGGQYT